MIVRIVVLLTFLAGNVCAQGSSVASWRLDYFHTGGPGLEAFSLDAVVVEPVAFSGHPSGYVDPVSTGGYQFELRSTSG